MPISRTHRGSRAHVLVLSAVALAMACSALVLGARPAAAHATLLAVSPADDALIERAPDAVELRFDEPVEVVAGGIRVFGPDGERVDRGTIDSQEGGAFLRAAVDGDLEGTYTVAWRVLSEDSHNLAGSFVFHVGRETGSVGDLGDEADPVVDGAGGVGRWLGLAGLLTAIGAGGVALLAAGEVDASARARRLTSMAATAGALGAVLALVAQAADASGRSLLSAIELVPDLALDTRTGQLTALRIGVLGALALAVAVGPQFRHAAWLTLGVGSVAALALTTAGHAWTAPNRPIAIAADLTHLLSAGGWGGGLLAFLLALPVATDRPALAQRFSKAALVAAVLVGISGSVSAFIQVRSVEALTSTGYGQLVLAKLVGFAALLLLGWRNRVQLVPAVAKHLRLLVQAIRLEVAIVAAVLVVTAGLVNQPPARNSLSEPFSTVVEADDAVLQVSVTPARVGSNDIHMYFFDDASQTLPVDAVEITAGTADIPPRRLDITPITSSHVSAYGASLTSPGTWTLTVTAVRAGVPVTFTIEVPVT